MPQENNTQVTPSTVVASPTVDSALETTTTTSEVQKQDTSTVDAQEKNTGGA
jgi:hypothetical protein